MEFTKEDVIQIMKSIMAEKMNADNTFNFDVIHECMVKTNHKWGSLDESGNFTIERVPSTNEIKKMVNHLFESCYDNLINDINTKLYDDFSDDDNVYEVSCGGLTVEIQFFPKSKENNNKFSEDDWSIVQYKYEITSKERI